MCKDFIGKLHSIMAKTGAGARLLESESWLNHFLVVWPLTVCLTFLSNFPQSEMGIISMAYDCCQDKSEYETLEQRESSRKHNMQLLLLLLLMLYFSKYLLFYSLCLFIFNSVLIISSSFLKVRLRYLWSYMYTDAHTHAYLSGQDMQFQDSWTSCTR